MPDSFQFPVLVPQDCEGCGLCCEGIGSPVAIYTYRLSHSGGYLYRPPTLPEELGREIDEYFAGLKNGEEPLGHCLWFDPQTRRCKHHAWRPNVCRQYEVGCTACLDERRPYVTGTAAAVAKAEEDVPQPETQPAGNARWLLVAIGLYLAALLAMYPLGAHGGAGYPTTAYAGWLGYVFASAPLLAMWCVLGPGSGFLRAIPALVMLVGMISLVPDNGMDVVVLFQAMAASVPLAVMRSLGCSLGLPRSHGARRRRAQFTLAHLVLWTVGAALLLAVASFFHRAAPQQAARSLLMAVALCLGPWAALWAAMGQQTRIGRWLVVGLTPCIAVPLVQTIIPAATLFLLFMVVSIQTGVVASILLAARVAGVRWVD